jgi:hypothetical protein
MLVSQLWREFMMLNSLSSKSYIFSNSYMALLCLKLKYKSARKSASMSKSVVTVCRSQKLLNILTSFTSRSSKLRKHSRAKSTLMEYLDSHSIRNTLSNCKGQRKTTKWLKLILKKMKSQLVSK